MTIEEKTALVIPNASVSDSSQLQVDLQVENNVITGTLLVLF